MQLHEEYVEVERHPMDCLVDASLFKGTTTKVQAKSEEAVVGKGAQVVEKVALHEEANDRTETVRGVGTPPSTDGATNNGTNAPREP